MMPGVSVFPRSNVTGFFHRGRGKWLKEWADTVWGWCTDFFAILTIVCVRRWLCCLNNPVGFSVCFIVCVFSKLFVCVHVLCVCMSVEESVCGVCAYKHACVRCGGAEGRGVKARG